MLGFVKVSPVASMSNLLSLIDLLLSVFAADRDVFLASIPGILYAIGGMAHTQGASRVLCKAS